jgi:hypothetical protein
MVEPRFALVLSGESGTYLEGPFAWRLGGGREV